MAKKRRTKAQKIESCVKQLKRDPHVDNPWAVCTAAQNKKRKKKTGKDQ